MAMVLLVSACDEEKKDAAQQAGGQTPPAVNAGFVTVKPEAITLVAEMPGRTVAFRKADVRPQVDGIIKERSFTEGSFVKAGQPLYQIDKSRYQANFDAAQAELANQRSKLDLASKNRKRYEDLRKSRTASEQSYDDAVATEAQAKAGIEAARANLERARIDLNYTTVTAPISGQIGASAYSEGALVTASQSNLLATITQLDPIYVDVTQAGGKLLDIRTAISSGRLQNIEDSKVDVRLVIEATGQAYPDPGTLQFSDVIVNETTGTVRLRAVFPNPDNILLPGMFVRGYVEQGRIDNGFLVPQRAVMRRPDGSAYVYTMGEDNKVVPKTIKIEQSRGENWIVIAGMESGDRVIVDGLQRIAPGAMVTPVDVEKKDTKPANETAADKSDKTPKPAETSND
ncbi:efflux RND transporter periplasmic adaptor subunit [Sneathiella sp.]|uniref:efflux RND transporter periplasmic adaptor subunit n=1 Tax=Sneathiella sp. TaxID=1964365 RepID=UPI003561928C